MRRLPITQDIASQLRLHLGADADVSNYSVFEAIGVNSLPIRKKHFLFKDAVIERSTMEEMATGLLRESIPLQIMHDSEPLPAGRVFAGRVNDTFYGPELRVLFWVDDNHSELIEKIEAGTVDQVSVGMMAKTLQCSSCEFDYLSDKTGEHIMTRTCANDHELGKDGTHLRLKGLDHWFELSLVGQGGAQGAKIVRRDQSVFGETQAYRLAASGIDPNMLVLSASPDKVEEMDLKAVIDEITDLKATVKDLNTKIETLTADVASRDEQITALTATIAERDATIAEHETQLAVLPERDAEITELKATIETNLAAVKDAAKRKVVALGDIKATRLDGKDSVEDLLAVLSAKDLQTVPGGVGRDATTVVTARGTTSLDAFRS